jgi:hypothetical protein
MERAQRSQLLLLPKAENGLVAENLSRQLFFYDSAIH